MFFHSFNIGFIDIPGTTTLNIYTVGCPHKCKGCHTQDLQNFEHLERKFLTVDLISEKLENGSGFYQGICWLGGDPLFQFDEFIRINKELKLKYPNLLLTCFTGYKLDELSIEQQKQLNEYIDILVDRKMGR
jgi:anaerobic ribonucleoside-triphosphate reductase activating protein